MWQENCDFEKWVKTQVRGGILNPYETAFNAGARSQQDLIDKLSRDNKKLTERQRPLERLVELVFRLQQFPNEEVFIRPEIEKLLLNLGYC